MQVRRWTALLVAVAMLTGCASLKPPSKWFGDKEEEIAYGTPAKIVAIWTNSVFNRTGDPAVRGLGGRVYFYDEDHHPIAVKGKMAVFLYDDSLPGAETKQEASRAVHFTAEQVAKNFSPTEFGPSYSFWVPWDQVGGERIELSVIPVFTQDDGRMLVGEQARHLLPGKAPAAGLESELTTEIAQAANITEIGENQSDGKQVALASAEDKGSAQLAVDTTTIKLPPAMQRRMATTPPKRENSPIGRRSSIYDQESMLERLEAIRQRSQPTATTVPDESSSDQGAITERLPLSVRSQPGPLQAQTSPFSQPKSGPARSLLGRGEKLFDRLR